MKNLLCFLIILAICGCAREPHKAKIVSIYQDSDKWKTIVHLTDTGGRQTLNGLFGTTGEEFTVWYDPNNYQWFSAP